MRVDFDSQIKLEFHGAAITSDAGSIAYRELDKALSPTGDRKTRRITDTSNAPAAVKHGTPTTLREKLVKIGAKVVRQSKYVTFQLAEVAVPRQLFATILERIGRLAIPLAACRSG